MNLPNSFIAVHGNGVDFNRDEKLEVGSDDYISWHLLNRAVDATNLTLKQVGHTSLRVKGAYLPSLKPRAFAYWSSKSPRDYVIACNRGTSETIRHILVEGNFQSLLPANSIALSKLHIDDIYALAVSLTLASILYHEVTHVTRFHLPYLVEKKQEGVDAWKSAIKMCEVDADKWASYLIAPELLAQAKGIRSALRLAVPVEIILREVLTLYGVAMHLWFTFNNESSFPRSSIYPHPLIRSTRMTIGAADNIPTETGDMEQFAIERAINILDGLNAVENTHLRNKNANQHPFDLAKEIFSINEKLSSIENFLEPALREVRARWGEPKES